MQRVEAEIRARGETLAAFAARIGVRSQDINNWKKRGIPRSKQQVIAAALGWTLDQLLSDPSDPVRLSSLAGVSPSPASSAPAKAAGATVADHAGSYPSPLRASNPNDTLWQPSQQLVLVRGQPELIAADANASSCVSSTWLMSQGLAPESLVAYRVDDDSMQPLLYARDYILIDLSQRAPSADGVYAIAAPGLLLIRRLTIAWDASWILQAENREKYPDQMVPRNDQGTRVEILGRARWRSGPLS